VMLVSLTAVMLASCTTSSQTNAQKKELTNSARGVIGTSLIGAKGATPSDERKIGRTAARLCGTGVWTKAECATHQREVN
jgi:hypothetical protein